MRVWKNGGAWAPQRYDDTIPLAQLSRLLVGATIRAVDVGDDGGFVMLHLADGRSYCLDVDIGEEITLSRLLDEDDQAWDMLEFNMDEEG